MKSTRHSLILEIIEQKDIETQEELAEELKRRGVKVTQATVCLLYTSDAADD